jgi:hypothetical protein
MHPATDPSTTPVYGVCPSKMRNLTSTAPQKQACARRGMSKASEQELHGLKWLDLIDDG